jgi:hypothetical protein
MDLICTPKRSTGIKLEICSDPKMKRLEI